ncbi:three component ABC system middle component [Oceanibacterium hippocampi]|uniref:three component ABC system middle component n=1 Tax=Oceanibacterium hippocampi TaxID=745714 RepID=UPI00111C46AE|nr:three component ABC system middle component [Oceanibacterium hippocampi]
MREHWQAHAREESVLFNPAFLGSLLCDFSHEFYKAKSAPCPVTLTFLAAGISLHRQTRQMLPGTTATALYEWLQDHQDVLVDLPRRVRGLSPFLREALMFSLHQNTLKFEAGHGLVAGTKKGHFTPAILKSSTPDMIGVVQRMRFLARWFAKSGSEASILAAWGVRP